MAIRKKAPAALEVVGLRLKAVRTAGKMTQDQTAAILGVEQSTYAKWETGKRAPDALILARFTARFRVSLDFIFQGDASALHPQLLAILQRDCPDLLAENSRRTDFDKDTALAAYRLSILADADQ